MKRIHYALASISYHKVITFFTTFFCLLFTFILTSLLNLTHLEKELLLFQQKIQVNTTQKAYHEEMISHYQALYFWLLLGFIVVFLILYLNTLIVKKAELKVWHLLGFSKRSMIKQLLCETFGPLLLGMGSMLLFILLFQRTYICLLWQLRLALVHFVQAPETAFIYFNSETSNLEAAVSAMSPNLTVRTIHTFTVDLNNIGYSNALKDWAFTSGVLLLLVLIIALPITLLFIHYQKKKRRFFV
jgi:hypothetical protein